MNQWKSGHTVDTKFRTLEDALKDADVFLGLSVPGSVTKEMVKNMAIFFTISFVTDPGTDKPKKTSASFRASSKVLNLVSTV